MIIEVIVSILILCASLVMVLAAIGVLTFPDVPTRMHATTKSGVLATSLIMVAVALYFTETDVSTRVIAIIVFLLVTAPVAAHAIGRAAYFAGVPLWSGTIKDELGEYYSPEQDGNTQLVSEQESEPPPG